jgi:hypothetical protein
MALTKFAACALLVSILGCGGGADEQQELKDYVQKLQGFADMNSQINSYVSLLNDPTNEVSAEDLIAARKLIDDYVAAMQAIPVTMEYTDLRRIHALYRDSKLADAKRLAADTNREIKRERGNVAIGIKHVTKMVSDLYKNLDVLWLRQDIKTDFPLKWPEG